MHNRACFGKPFGSERVNGHWLVEKISDKIYNLVVFELCVRSIQVTDNHSADVDTFPALIKITL